MKHLALLALLLPGLGLAVESTSPAPVPGEPKSLSSRVLGAGADILQDTTPPDQIHSYLNGFHFVHGSPQQQEEAHHYCHQMSEEFHQCVIYDGNGKQAKLIGIEHVISERLHRGLPKEEQGLWHPHKYEVQSGLLVAPGLPDGAEHALMERLVNTWGKTWHVWHTARDKLPVGQASLMMGFTADGQIDPAMVQSRDRRFGIVTAEKRQQRSDIKAVGETPAPPALAQR